MFYRFKWSHLAWKNTEVNKGGIGNIKYPLIADITKSIARDYDVLMGLQMQQLLLTMIQKQLLMEI